MEENLFFNNKSKRQALLTSPVRFAVWFLIFAFHIAMVIYAYMFLSSKYSPWSSQFFFLSLFSLIAVNIGLLYSYRQGTSCYSIYLFIIFLISIPTDLPFFAELLILIPVVYELYLWLQPFKLKVVMLLLFSAAVVIHISHYFDSQTYQYVLDTSRLVITSSVMSVNAAVMLLGSWFLMRLNAYKKENTRLQDTLRDISLMGEQALLYAADAKRESAEYERNRITREIHDSLGYVFTNIIMLSEAMTHVIHDVPRLKTMLQDLKQQSAQGLQETRSILRIMRSDNFTPKDTLNSLLLRLKELSKKGAFNLNINVEFGGTIAISDKTILNHLQKIFQEAIVNTIKHGKAKNMYIQVRQDRKNLNIYISDDGLGCQSITQGIGLKSMQERALQMKGVLEYESTKMGFTIKVMIPLRSITDEQHKNSAG